MARGGVQQFAATCAPTVRHRAERACRMLAINRLLGFPVILAVITI